MKFEFDISDLEETIQNIVKLEIDKLYDKLAGLLPTKDNQHYRPAQIAKMLGFDNQTVYKWIKLGKLKTVKLGHYKTIAESELNNFLQNYPQYKLKQKRLLNK